MKKVKINKRIYGTVIICPDTFREIKHYVEIYYDECSIVIERQYDTDECDSLNHGYILIRQYTDTILKITITAHKGDNIFTMCLNNQPKVGEGTLTIKAEIEKDMVEMLKNSWRAMQVPPSYEYMKEKRLPTFLLVFGSVMFFRSLFKLLPDNIEDIVVVGVLAALLIWTAIDNMVLPAIKAKNQGVKLVKFWTEQQRIEALEKRIAKRERNNTISTIIGIVLIALSILVIILGG